MFLQIPEVELLVPGIHVECELIPENMADTGYEHQLRDEHLQIWVQYDGSNPFGKTEECSWMLIVVAATTYKEPQLNVDEENPCTFHCLPAGVTVTKVTVAETTYCEKLGVWLLIKTSDESGIGDFGAILVPYPQVN